MRSMSVDDRQNVAALEDLVRAALARGDVDEAEGLLNRILKAVPRLRSAETMLIELWLGTGRKAEAEALARESVALYPFDDETHAMIGAILSTKRALVEGEWHLRKALELGGRQARRILNLARNLKDQGRLDEAMDLADEAAALFPDIVGAHILQAEIHEQRGDLENADDALGRVTALATVEAEDLAISRASVASHGPRWKEALDALDAVTDLAPALRLVRGRLRERSKRHDEAWQDFVEGKAALSAESEQRYDRAEVERHYSAVVRVFSAPFWRNLSRVDIRRDAPQPIFIMGFPRSGTTMIEQVIASHSKVRAGGELPFVGQLCAFAQTLFGRGQPFPAGIGDLAVADNHHFAALFRDFYLARAALHGLTTTGVDFFTDKMPLNEAYLPLIRLAFPEARIVWLRRHPLDVLVSVMSHNMTHGFNCCYRLADAAHQFAAVGQLVAYYRDQLEIDFLELSYERFVADQDGETRRLMNYIGMEPEPAQFRFHESARHAPTPSYAQVRKPVNAGSVERWRPYQEHLRPVFPMLRDILAEGGYEIGGSTESA